MNPTLKLLHRRIPGAQLVRVLTGVPGWSDATLLWSHERERRFGGLMLFGDEARMALKGERP